MAFGQQSGPPATARQVQELLGLLHGAGHVDFRDARGPMGFTQRQAGGRFTRDEAEGFIARLQDAESGTDPPDDEGPDRAGPMTDGRPARPARPAPPDRALARIPDERLASELRRRGWTVVGP
jgi:hypothetical protein